MKTRRSFTHTARPSWKELKRLQKEKERRAMRQWEQDQQMLSVKNDELPIVSSDSPLIEVEDGRLFAKSTGVHVSEMKDKNPKICILCGEIAEDGHACEVMRHVEMVLKEK